MEKSLSAINKVVGELQAVEYERDLNQGFKDIVSKDNGNELI